MHHAEKNMGVEILSEIIAEEFMLGYNYSYIPL